MKCIASFFVDLDYPKVNVFLQTPYYAAVKRFPAANFGELLRSGEVEKRQFQIVDVRELDELKLQKLNCVFTHLPLSVNGEVK